MQHFQSRWVWPLLVALPLTAGRWEIFFVLAGTVLAGQSLHESIHHPTTPLAQEHWRWLGVLIALLSACLLRFPRG